MATPCRKSAKSGMWTPGTAYKLELNTKCYAGMQRPILQITARKASDYKVSQQRATSFGSMVLSVFGWRGGKLTSAKRIIAGRQLGHLESQDERKLEAALKFLV